MIQLFANVVGFWCHYQNPCFGYAKRRSMWQNLTRSCAARRDGRISRAQNSLQMHDFNITPVSVQIFGYQAAVAVVGFVLAAEQA